MIVLAEVKHWPGPESRYPPVAEWLHESDLPFPQQNLHPKSGDRAAPVFKAVVLRLAMVIQTGLNRT